MDELLKTMSAWPLKSGNFDNRISWQDRYIRLFNSIGVMDFFFSLRVREHEDGNKIMVC